MKRMVWLPYTNTLGRAWLSLGMSLVLRDLDRTSLGKARPSLECVTAKTLAYTFVFWLAETFFWNRKVAESFLSYL